MQYTRPFDGHFAWYGMKWDAIIKFKIIGSKSTYRAHDRNHFCKRKKKRINNKKLRLALKGTIPNFG